MEKRGDGVFGAAVSGSAIVAFAIVALTMLGGCGGGDHGPMELRPEPPRAAEITISPDSVTLAMIGETATFTASITDQFGAAFSGTVIWSSDAPHVFTVDANGTVTGVGNGSGMVVATHGSLSATASVNVNESSRAAEITISPDSVTLAMIGETATFTASITDQFGAAFSGTVIWSSDAPHVFTVDANGTVTGVGNGSGMVVATHGSLSATASVNVNESSRAAEITISPDSVTLAMIGETATFTASITDQFGAAFSGTVIWSSDAPHVFTVDANGTVTAVANGSGTVTAAFESLSATASVTVEVKELPAPSCDMTPPPLDPTPVPPVEVACEDWAEFHAGPDGRVQVSFTGDRWYNNNVWNKADAGGEPYEQCILRRVVDGEDEYGWRWRWPLGITGDVKGYPEVIHGFKPWNLPTRSALPKRISALRELRVDYEAYLAAEGAYNLAFSMWVTRDNPPTSEGITHEIMVWMDRSCDNQPYPNSRVAEVEIGGATYTLVIESAESTFGQTFVAFVSHTDQLAGSVDFAPFLAYLVEHGHLPADHYVNDVELGNEAISGTGELWLKTFEVEVR